MEIPSRSHTVIIVLVLVLSSFFILLAQWTEKAFVDNEVQKIKIMQLAENQNPPQGSQFCDQMKPPECPPTISDDVAERNMAYLQCDQIKKAALSRCILRPPADISLGELLRAQKDAQDKYEDMSSGEKVGIFFSPSPTQSPKDRTNTEHKANHPSQPTSSLPDSHTAIVDLASEGQYSLAASIFGISLILTWGIGLIPPIIIRYALMRAPLKKGTAIGICFLLLVVNLAISLKVNEGEHSSNAHPALVLVAAVSYWILRKDPRTLPPQSVKENAE